MEFFMLVNLVHKVLPMCLRIPVGRNVFLLSSECLSSVESCVILDNFTLFCYCVQLSAPFRHYRKDDLFYSHCNGEAYKSYFCFVTKVSLNFLIYRL